MGAQCQRSSATCAVVSVHISADPGGGLCPHRQCYGSGEGCEDADATVSREGLHLQGLEDCQCSPAECHSYRTQFAEQRRTRSMAMDRLDRSN